MTEEEVPQTLLPLPTAWPVSPDAEHEPIEYRVEAGLKKISMPVSLVVSHMLEKWRQITTTSFFLRKLAFQVILLAPRSEEPGSVTMWKFNKITMTDDSNRYVSEQLKSLYHFMLVWQFI